MRTYGSIPTTPRGCLDAVVGLVLFAVIFRWVDTHLTDSLLLALILTVPVWTVGTWVLAFLLTLFRDRGATVASIAILTILVAVLVGNPATLDVLLGIVGVLIALWLLGWVLAAFPLVVGALVGLVGWVGKLFGRGKE